MRKLSFQVSNIIGKHLFQVAIHINNDGNGYSRFSCGNGYAEQAEEMAFQLSGEKITVEYREIDVGCIKHQFYRNQQSQQVFAGKESVDAVLMTR